MARDGRANRFTVYDVMESKGLFEANPANVVSPEYAGPVPYPKMLYHPKGKTRVTQKAEVIRLPDGSVERLGEQVELIYRLVNSIEEEKAALKEGWHDHPAKSVVAGGGEAQLPDETMEEMEAEILRLRKELEEVRKSKAEKSAA